MKNSFKRVNIQIHFALKQRALRKNYAVQEGDPDEAKRRSEGAISPLKRSNFFSPTFCKIIFGTFPKKYNNKKIVYRLATEAKPMVHFTSYAVTQKFKEENATR